MGPSHMKKHFKKSAIAPISFVADGKIDDSKNDAHQSDGHKNRNKEAMPKPTRKANVQMDPSIHVSHLQETTRKQVTRRSLARNSSISALQDDVIDESIPQIKSKLSRQLELQTNGIGEKEIDDVLQKVDVAQTAKLKRSAGRSRKRLKSRRRVKNDSGTSSKSDGQEKNDLDGKEKNNRRHLEERRRKRKDEKPHVSKEYNITKIKSVRRKRRKPKQSQRVGKVRTVQAIHAEL